MLHRKGSSDASENPLSTLPCFAMNGRCTFFPRRSPTLTLVLPLPPRPTMLASSSTLERLRSSPRSSSGSEALKRHTQSSPLSNSHTAGAFTSPSTDTLIQDSQHRASRPRRKGLSWNLPWQTNRGSSTSAVGLILPAPEIVKAEGGQATPLKTPWHHGWRSAFFGSCAPQFVPHGFVRG